MNRRSTSTLGLSKGLDDTLLVPQDYNAAMEEVSHRTSQTWYRSTDQGDCASCLMVYNCVTDFHPKIQCQANETKQEVIRSKRKRGRE